MVKLTHGKRNLHLLDVWVVSNESSETKIHCRSDPCFMEGFIKCNNPQVIKENGKEL